MKHIDNFLKKLKTDRNTFATYILLMISIYIVVDRFIEILFIGGTGMGVTYWGPIKYTLALACLVFALEFSFASKFVTEDRIKLSFLYIFVIGFYIVVMSMIIQWINAIEWALFFSIPNYEYIFDNFFELMKPAFSAIAWYIPIISFYPVFKFYYFTVNDTKDIRDSIFDCPGIDLSDNKQGYGPYTCEMSLFKDTESGKLIKTPELRRFETTLIVGVSGSGKTSMVFEPMLARDIERKYFFREVSKELGFTALRTGLATLTKPYSNEYLNDNFNLNMLIPNQAKEKLFKSFLNKMILNSSGDNYTYKNVGMTYMAPDYETIDHMTEVAKNFNLTYNLIDPLSPTSDGLNPFVYKDPIKASLAISAILHRLYIADMPKQPNINNSLNTIDMSLAKQAVENLVILLKVVYQKVNEDALPTLEDLYNLFNDFSLVEKTAKVLEDDEKLSEQYRMQLNYIKENFYHDASPDNVKRMKALVTIPNAQLEKLLRHPGVKNILCNRFHNVDYENALENGEVTFVCTRRGDLGATTQQAFGLFFLLLMQQSVLSRPGTEKTRIPHFLYIDEFTPFIDQSTMDIFTLYRKYRVGAIVSCQSLSQLGDKTSETRQVILANSATKAVFGNNTPEDNEWWEVELGDKREWTFKNNYHTQDAKKGDGQPGYDENYADIKYAWTNNYKKGKINALKAKQLLYKTRDLKGKMIVGKSKVDFLDSRYKETQKIKKYNFAKFVQGVNTNDDDEKEKKFDFSKIDFSNLDKDDANVDGPIVRNPNRTFEFNRVGSNYVNPIRTDKSLNQAIEDYHNKPTDNK
ncbi:MAG: TraM recognition domain-containing protein [Clostridia bacterium]|nr:TraM recognition domain-containing protein [Clostridia bacterium]